MTHFGQDFRYALRSLRKRPAFSIIVIAALAVCIGANTAIFSIVNSVLLRGLPFHNSTRLVVVSELIASVMPAPIPFSAPDYLELAKRNRSFSNLGIFTETEFELSGIDHPDRLTGTRISASLFPTLEIAPALGRNFTEEEDRNHARVAILSAALWHSRFASDPRILGKAILLDRTPYTVVGVMPGNLVFPLRGPAFNNDPAAVFVPISFSPYELSRWGNMYNDSVIARLRPGVTLAQARADVRAVVERVYNEHYPAMLHNGRFTLGSDVTPLRDDVLGNIQPALLVLFAAVGLVLLIGCADVASLLLTRSAGRQREMAIRTALGASRSELISQVLLESVVLALLGGAFGLLVSVWATRALVNLATANLPLATQVHLDPAVLLFTLGLSCLTALFFGLFPALHASHIDVNEGLREGSRGQTASRKQGRTLNILVVAQFALALVLLVGAGLLLRSFSRLLSTNPGFRPDRVLSLSVSLPTNAYQSPAAVRSFFERLLTRIQTVPGVKSAAFATSLPLSVNEHDSFSVEAENPAVATLPHHVSQIWSMGDFFKTMGIPLVRGRLFDRRDGPNAPAVAIIGQTLARRFFPHQDPIGQHIKWGVPDSISPWMTIVGVVGDVKQGALDQQTDFETYTPYEQIPDKNVAESADNEFRHLKVVVRTANNPLIETSAIEQQVRSLDPSLPVTGVTTMEAALHDSTRSHLLNTVLLGAFAGTALLLAALGIGGVLAYSVAQRISEIGLRLALGAGKAEVLRLVIVRGLKIALLGAAIGLACSLALTRLMTRLLFEVSPFDLWTLLAAPLVLCLVALLSIWIPARRAAAIDPIQALRVE